MNYNDNCGFFKCQSCLSLQYFQVGLAEMSGSTLHEFHLLRVLFLPLQIFHFMLDRVSTWFNKILNRSMVSFHFQTVGSTGYLPYFWCYFIKHCGCVELSSQEIHFVMDIFLVLHALALHYAANSLAVWL